MTDDLDWLEHQEVVLVMLAVAEHLLALTDSADNCKKTCS